MLKYRRDTSLNTGSTTRSVTAMFNLSKSDTVELDLIAMEILVFPSNSPRNENDRDPTDEKTSLVLCMTGVISIAQSNDSDD